MTDIKTTDSRFAFQVAVDNMLVTQGSNLTLLLETIISDPPADSPDLPLANFQLVSYPNQAAHTTAGKIPALTRLTDNGHCSGTSTLPCAISWSIVLPELTETEAGGTVSAYNQQYIGSYNFAVRTHPPPLITSVLGDLASASSHRVVFRSFSTVDHLDLRRTGCEPYHRRGGLQLDRPGSA